MRRSAFNGTLHHQGGKNHAALFNSDVCNLCDFIVFSSLIYRGRTELIHSYHRENVTDRVGYGKAFGKALLVVAASPLVSGIIGLLGTQDRTAVAAVIVLIVGLVIGFTALARVQKKWNGGIF